MRRLGLSILLIRFREYLEKVIPRLENADEILSILLIRFIVVLGALFFIIFIFQFY